MSCTIVLMARDNVIDYVIACAKQAPQIKEVILFGSRARGDHHSRSDYDFAVVVAQWSPGEWAKWSLDLRDQAPTLCGLDLVLIEQGKIAGKADHDLIKAIKAEGKLIYERQQSK